MATLQTVRDGVLVDETIVPNPRDIYVRIGEFRKLKDGWLDGEGKAPSHDSLYWVASTLERNLLNKVALPYLYPTVDGGVQAEWSFENWEISLDIDIEKKTACWQTLEVSSGGGEDKDNLNLDDADAWEWILNELKAKGGEQV